MKKILKLSLLMLLVMMTLVGCGNKESNKEVALGEILNSVKKELGENYIPSRKIDKEELEMLTGLTLSDYDEFIAEGPMMSTHIDTIMMFKTGKSEIVEEKLESYRTKLINDSMQYPMNMAKLNASKVVTHDNYVFFLMLGAIDDDSVDESESFDFAREEIEKIEQIISKLFE